MIELICQHDGGANPFVGNAGMHHTAHFADDLMATSAMLGATGAPEALFARTAGGTGFAMHDRRAELGHYVEVYEPTRRLRGFYDLVRDAAADWHGADPIRLL
jgi:hypothetical protein